MIDNIYRLTFPGCFLLLGIVAGYIAGRIEAAIHNRKQGNKKQKGRQLYDGILS